MTTTPTGNPGFSATTCVMCGVALAPGAHKFCLPCASKTGANFSRSITLLKLPLPDHRPSLVELAWAAGFLEGEGCFYSRSIVATQVERWALDKLVAMFGGSLSYELRARPRKDLFRWKCHGQHAQHVLNAVAPWLSPHKARQANETPLQASERRQRGQKRQGR